jgi:hypothetical protein
MEEQSHIPAGQKTGNGGAESHSCRPEDREWRSRGTFLQARRQGMEEQRNRHKDKTDKLK